MEYFMPKDGYTCFPDSNLNMEITCNNKQLGSPPESMKKWIRMADKISKIRGCLPSKS